MTTHAPYEIYEELLKNLQLRLLAVEDQHCQPGWIYPPEVLPYNKFFCIYEGEGWIRIDDQEFFPSAGDIVLLPEGHIQSVREINENRYKKIFCHFSAKIGSINLFDILDVPYCVSYTDKFPGMLTLFRELLSAANATSPLRALRVQALLLCIIECYLADAGHETKYAAIDEYFLPFQQVIEHMISHMASPLSIDAYAERLNLHPSTFIRTFKRLTGMTPKQYLLEQRITKARLLLASTGLSITTIAESVGYTDTFSFSHAFKRMVGISPVTYREQVVHASRRETADRVW